MLVFVDESGDPGLKKKEGSSHVFVLSLVIFKQNEDADEADRVMREFRASLGRSPQFEFKFNKLNDSLRRQLLQTISTQRFVYYCMVINKQKIYSKGLTIKESFYKYVCSLAFTNARHLLERSIIVIDGSGSREFRRQLQNYLKRKINDPTEAIPCISKVKIKDSKRNDLLQLADMVSGAVAKAFQTQANRDESFRRIINKREGYVQFWPK